MKTLSKFTCLIVLLGMLSTTIIQAQAKRKLNTTLQKELLQMREIDQIAVYKNYISPRKETMTEQQRNVYKDSVFKAHLKRLGEIFDQYGFPGYDLAGESGSQAFWLMVQHLDEYVGFQQKVLKAMKKEVKQGNANGQNFAYLTDRVLVNTGHKQKYGTQVLYDNSVGKPYPKPLQNPKKVDEYRKAVGMESLNEYLNGVAESHFQMNKQFFESKGITKPYQYETTKK
ncbi:MAG TPA: hypothetical protein DCS93_08460 [Microscillaceae bacterium]|nr:hypothetical protein [Microscillaceae bacterium]